ncbi:MAG: NAD-dependent epimerase/dehydratase family protein, partial [Pirellulales bacterium]
MHALVTGAGGFLGLYITEQLVARGDRVRAFCRGRYERLDALGVETVQGDIRDSQQVENACTGVDVVYHVASISGIWGPWQQYFDVNTRGTDHVLAGCRRHRVPLLVYTSSPSVTFDGQPQQGVDESEPYARRWLCHYPHSKALAEQRVLEASGTGSLRCCALRPHLIWGPRDRHLIPRLLERARQGTLRRVGDGTNLIDTIYVENAALAHLQAADALAAGRPLAGKAYFISQGEPLPCWAWIDRILDLAGLPPVERSISLRTAWWIGAAFEWFHSIRADHREPRMTRFLAAQLGMA